MLSTYIFILYLFNQAYFPLQHLNLINLYYSQIWTIIDLMASQEKSRKVSRRTPMKHTRVSKFICGFKSILSVLLGRTRLHPKQEVEAPEKELWIIKDEHNLNNSPIYRLPNELIPMVMTLLPLESLHLSRQAGHRFMVVFARPEFAHLHRGNHMRMNHASHAKLKPSYKRMRSVSHVRWL